MCQSYASCLKAGTPESCWLSLPGREARNGSSREEPAPRRAPAADPTSPRALGSGARREDTCHTAPAHTHNPPPSRTPLQVLLPGVGASSSEGSGAGCAAVSRPATGLPHPKAGAFWKPCSRNLQGRGW